MMFQKLMSFIGENKFASILIAVFAFGLISMTVGALTQPVKTTDSDPKVTNNTSTTPVNTTPKVAEPTKPYSSISDGIYVVGTDITSGVYKTQADSSCYYARLSSLSTDDIIDNHFGKGQILFEVKDTDKAVEIKGCTFVKQP